MSSRFSFTGLFIAFICLWVTNPSFAADEIEPASNNAKSEETEITPPTNSNFKPRKIPPFYKRFLHMPSFAKLQYYFVAQNAKNCDLFYGLVIDNPLIGRASVDFIFPNGCECKGIAQVTHFPLFGGAVGQSGYIKAKCTDGRDLKGNFTTTSLTTGYGKMTDSLGNEYEGTFGHTAEQAVKEVNALRIKLHCPECNPDDIEMKVQGQILR